MKRIRADKSPYPMVFIVNGYHENCPPTGFKVFLDGLWWDEFIDHNSEYHYSLSQRYGLIGKG